MNRRERFYIGLIVLIGMTAWLTGCASCRPDCRELSYDQCQSMRRDCERINQSNRKPMKGIFTPHFKTDMDNVMVRPAAACDGYGACAKVPR